MKRVVFVLIAALTLSLPVATSITYYAGSGYGWQTSNTWNHQNYQFLPSHNTPLYQRPEGYGLVPHNRPSPYPPRGWAGTQYCDNQELLGHTSAWRPGRYHSGLDGRMLPQPRQRAATTRCPATRPINHNRYNTPYW